MNDFKSDTHTYNFLKPTISYLIELKFDKSNYKMGKNYTYGKETKHGK